MGVLRRKSPLFRRKSSRNVSAIEAEVDYIVQRSPFLMAVEDGSEGTTRAQHEEDAVALAPSPAPVPTFSRKEYQTGTLLGSGSFSNVYAIIGFKLSSKQQQQQQQQQASLVGNSSEGRNGSSSQLVAAATTTTSSENNNNNNNNNNSPQELRVRLSRSAFDESGEARYAVKMVKKELSKKQSNAFCNAAADLIVEAKYLSALNHRNILKLRGIARDGCAGFLDGHDGFFFIVDRLEETLGDRITKWKQQQAEVPPHRDQDDLLALQANYALQIANALAYLHDRRILFRDLKPNNVGFAKDTPHTVQLFDFGLCRELPATSDSYSEQLNNNTDEDNEAFQMSGAGTYLYMAPEVINKRCYNLKADVYSWAFLFHEMIALERPFDEFTVEEHKEFVCEIGQRPSLTVYDLPQSIQTLLRLAWEQDPIERLTMRQVYQQLEPVVHELEQAQQQRRAKQEAYAAASETDGASTTARRNDDNNDGGGETIPPPPGWTRRSITRLSLLGRQALEAVSELMSN